MQPLEEEMNTMEIEAEELEMAESKDGAASSKEGTIDRDNMRAGFQSAKSPKGQLSKQKKVAFAMERIDEESKEDALSPRLQKKQQQLPAGIVSDK